jgi:acyl transferase domain-containing protein/acyl-CoA synthetase (AMP-forming)/AMP-acid ligase II/acyl carrier protein
MKGDGGFSPAPANTLVELLEQRASAPQGNYVFIKDGIGASELGFSRLAGLAKAIAVRVRMEASPQSRALLLYPPGLDFLTAFFGCLYAGIIPVPLPSPERARLKRALPRLQAIIQDAEPSLILVPSAIRDDLQQPVAAALPQLRWLSTDTVEAGLATQWHTPSQQPDDIAYLQYTSGSTTSPRGVMLTHANVMRNLYCFGAGMGYDARSIEVTWMPHFHDYGLVSGLLHPLYCNIPVHILSPLALLKRPVQWLQAITQHRATHSHGPNFAYELCIQRVTPEQKRLLDLSSWRTAGNGAETIRSDTLRRFADAFASCGFELASFYPAYGLAEATLFVTARRHSSTDPTLAVRADALAQHRVAWCAPSEPSDSRRSLVSCGVTANGADLRIVHPETRKVCPPDCVGEIWFADPSVAPGYWRRDAETRATFAARLANDHTAGPFLRTGDLGFLHQGELFVTGRLKDVIVVAGANHYPQDIEWSVQSACPEIRRDHCAAFAIERDGAEEVVIVAEPERMLHDWSGLIRRVRAVVSREHDLSVRAVAILPRGGVFKTSSGKVQRSACRDAFRDGLLTPVAMWVADRASDVPAATRDPADLQSWICAALADAIHCDKAAIDPNVPFAEYGLDSRAAVALVGMLEEWLGCDELSSTLLWEHPTAASLAAYVGRASPAESTSAVVTMNTEPIAIVGVACRFPGASDIDAFWDLLRDGRSAVGPGDRITGVQGGFLRSIEEFDASFFGLSASEAEAMDPQQRLMLEVAWEALEHAGISPGALSGQAAGVFVGISGGDHGFRQFAQAEAERAITAHTGTGLAFSIAANRLSYLLDLRGPSMAIDTACSSSLVAVHQACRSLRQGESTIALAGGVNLIISPHLHLAIERAGMLSPDGRCKTFDANADGYVRGEGCGVVVLKRWADAVRDKDTVFSIILASAVNQDGRSNGLTAPNPGAQQELICQALTESGLAPSDIGYVEAHGTGTRLGDPIEVAALQAVLGRGRAPTQQCWIGSVKTNIGHLEAAAGIAGLIKALLVLRHAEIVPHVNLRKLNPLLRLEGTPFRIASTTERWVSTDGGPRRAAVSSFGFGGTNSHVILEEAPPAPTEVEHTTKLPQLLVLSAETSSALNALAARHSAWLAKNPGVSVGDLCFTAATGRVVLAERLCIAAADPTAFRAALDACAANSASAVGHRGRAPMTRPRVAFLFSGQGSQYAGMGRRLYETDSVFRTVLDECDALLRDHLPRPLLSVIMGEASDLLNQTAYTQPALFVIEYALARLWQYWGIEPEAVLGHSVGEYVAACVAGVFELADGLKLVAARGRLMQNLPPGGCMLAVGAPEHLLAEILATQAIPTEVISLAAVNAPRSCVLSGDRAALEILHPRLTAAGLSATYLEVSHAFHSARLDPILDEFRRVASGLRYRQPRLALISNLDGQPLAVAPDAEYWTRHLRDAVRFADGVRTLAARCDVFLEIGPRPALSALAGQCLTNRDVPCIPSLRPGQDDRESMLNALARLCVAGATPDWHRFYRETQCRRVAGLPSYPFERQRFALPPLTASTASAQPTDVAHWGYVPHWVSVGAARRDEAVDWLIFSDMQGIGRAMQQVIASRSEPCATAFEGLTDRITPVHVIYLEALDWAQASALNEETLPRELETRFDRLVAVLRDIAEQSRRTVRLYLVTRGAAVGGPGNDIFTGLLQSLIWGLGRALRREFPDWRVRLIDLEAAAEPPMAAEQLLSECLSNERWPDVCWRDGERYALRLRPQPLGVCSEHARVSGTWLVTGGLGRLGGKLAEWLVRNGADRVILVGRRAPDAAMRARLQAMAAGGAAVEARALDVTDFASLQLLLSDLGACAPPLQGIIHAAGVLDDGMLHQQSAGRLQAVLAPKVLGGWYLHLLTRAMPLRHFILFSSAASLLGNWGQSAYAAANAFLDGLAWHRNRQGLPGLSIDWSAWSDAAADPRVAENLAREGLVAIATEDGLEAFGRALTIDVTQLAVLSAREERTLELPGPFPSMQPPLDASSPLVEILRGHSGRELATTLQAHILDLAAAIRGHDRSTFRPDLGLFQQGLDSLNAVELRNQLQREIGQPLPITLPFDFPTADTLADELLRRMGLAEIEATRVPSFGMAATEGGTIAVIGLGCRMPGRVDGPDAFWQLLLDGIDAITEVPPDRWDIDRLYDPDVAHPGTIVTRNGGFVEDVHWFDAAFFGISPREARHLDPQQRLLLEVCWETLEHAGVPPRSLLGSQTGVFVGISTNDYVYRLAREPERIDGYLGTGNALSVAANRLSYVFGLEGPSLAIDTACSSSLVAIHQACLSLRGGECDLAISGGVNLMLDPMISINHSRARMLAPDGRCKAFSATADGYVRSEGCGLVLLKRLADAQRDGDRILAVIRGSAVNQDGRSAGLTVPNGRAQQRVIRRALQLAQLAPADISYVEAHGTGTPLGDPVEIGALTEVFRGERRELAVGSVKTNIGHLEAAAGVAGLLKVVLALQHRVLPAHLHCAVASPEIDWAHSPVRICRTTTSWAAEDRPRRAGISSFGFGGTNGHVVVEEPPPLPVRVVRQLQSYVLPLSAKTASTLRQLAERMAAFLSTSATPNLIDICFTAAFCRDHFAHRLAVLGNGPAALALELRGWLAGERRAGAMHGVVGVVGQSGRPPLTASVDELSWVELAESYVRGVDPSWRAHYEIMAPRRVPIPGHPFERQHYAVDPSSDSRARAAGIYRLRWADLGVPLQPLPSTGDRWLVLADRGGWGEEIARHLAARGARCNLVYRAPVDPGQRGLANEDAAGMADLLAELAPLHGILYLWALDGPVADTLRPETISGVLRDSVALVPLLIRTVQSTAAVPRVWLGTQAAQAVSPEDRLDGLGQTPLWGLGRSLALELPKLWGGLVDLPSGPPTLQYAAAVASVLYSDAEDRQVALRRGRILAPRLEVFSPKPGSPLAIRPDGSYLISGGFGSLGREIGRWLVRGGARHLWLIGRRGPTTWESRNFVADLQAQGVAVEMACLDIADVASLAAQLAVWRRNGPQLRGVVHAAGVNAETPAASLDWPAIAALLPAKVQGGLALAQLTGDLELDFFLSISSVAALWGSQLQAAYGLANAFLDGLAEWQRARGVAALTIDFGPLEGSTMRDRQAELRRVGLHPIPLARACAELSLLLSTGVAQAALVEADWVHFTELYCSRCPTGLFDALVDSGAAKQLAPSDWSNRHFDEPVSFDYLRENLAGALAATLQLPPHAIDPDLPLPSLGLDSLGALDLRNRTRQVLGIDLALSDLLSEVSLNELMARVAGSQWMIAEHALDKGEI